MNPRNIRWYAWRAKRDLRQRVRSKTFLILCLLALLLVVGHQAGYVTGSY